MTINLKDGDYCGHLCIENGKITIDLGGRILADGSYSIYQDSQAARKAKKQAIKKPSYNNYNPEEFKKMVIEKIAGREITMPAFAREIGLAHSTMINRAQRLGIVGMFKTRKKPT